jgi:hypothetical protein
MMLDIPIGMALYSRSDEEDENCKTCALGNGKNNKSCKWPIACYGQHKLIHIDKVLEFLKAADKELITHEVGGNCALSFVQAAIELLEE